MESCDNGHINVVKLFLKQRLINDIVVQQDNSAKTGFIHAYLNKREDIVEALLNLPNNDAMLNVSFQGSCQMGPIEREDVFNVFKSLCISYSTEAKKYSKENEETKKWRNVLESILTKNDFPKMGPFTLGLKVTDHPSKENVTVISQEINEEKPLVIHMDTSNEVPTFKFNP